MSTFQVGQGGSASLYDGYELRNVSRVFLDKVSKFDDFGFEGFDVILFAFAVVPAEAVQRKSA